MRCAVILTYKQRGIGMLEVLVSIVILSIGLLGITGLQARALKGSQGSLQRSQAVALSYSILDAIRVDRANAVNYTMDRTCQPPASDSLVANTQAMWITSLKNAFHGSNAGQHPKNQTCGTINCIPSGESALCTITIDWDETRSGGSDTTTFQTKARI